MWAIKLFKGEILRYSHSLLLVIILSAVFNFTIILLTYYTGISVKNFTRDPNATAELPFYIGYFSQLGGVFWIASSSIALFTAIVKKSEFRNFLFYSGSFTLFLGLDDIFMIHDGMLIQLGISEYLFYSAYILLSIIYFLRFFKIMIKTPFVLLLLAFGFFAISVLNDVIFLPGIHPYIFEDCCKMIGIISLMVYHFILGKEILGD